MWDKALVVGQETKDGGPKKRDQALEGTKGPRPWKRVLGPGTWRRGPGD